MYKQKNNPFNAPILKVDMEDDVQGVANKDGTIHINKDINDPKQIEKIVAHESVHLDQMKRGDLDYTDDKVIWKGKEYSRDKMKEGAKNLPWEKEAYKRQDSFKLGNKKDPYKSFEEKGLISPLAKRKKKKSKTVVQRTTSMDYELPDQPKIYEPRDFAFIKEQNEIQKNKSLQDQFINRFITPSYTVEAERNKKPEGLNVSGVRSTVYNEKGAANNLSSSDVSDKDLDTRISDWISQSAIGKANMEEYENNPNFEYKDSSDGDEYTAGYYNVKTGERAREVDKSSNLHDDSSAATSGNTNFPSILKPSSYNIYTEGDPDGNLSKAFTTNYDFEGAQTLSGDLKTAQGLQSSVVTKGQKGRWARGQGRERTGIAGLLGLGFKDKKDKTILPKRKEFYDTYYDPKTNSVVTTMTKKFNRLKYDTADEFYVGNINNKTAKQVTQDEQSKAKKDWVTKQEEERKNLAKQQEELKNLRELYDS